VQADAARLFLLGDIFDLWVGPKQTALPYVVPIIRKMREVTAAGIEVHYMAGNRDFNFDARVNGGPPPRRLPETLTVDSGGHRLFLTHGDLLCTNDRAYRRARSIGRSLPVRFALAHLPLALSTFLSDGYRRLSARAVARKSRWEKAVDFSRVRAHLLHGHDAVVCGHVHRAARYRVAMPEDRSGEFITLGDWHREGVYLVSREGRLQLRKFA
jgi:UDP-2,3-diacylglucosamine hydrolase